MGAIARNRPCSVLLADHPGNWHWVLCVGFCYYSAGNCYMRIVTGWANTTDRYCLVNTGSLWITATEQ